jgi:anaerobic selenocysteine-containing dehydrogenase
VALSRQDADARGIASGDDVTVRSNGTSVTLRARIERDLRAGVVQIAEEHAGDLQPSVEVTK